MATLDVGLLKYFSGIFPMILVWALIYGLLSYVKPFGKNNAVYAIIGFVAGILVMFSQNAIDVINHMVPWFILFFILIMFLLMAYMFLGAKESDILTVLKGNQAIVYWLIIIFVVIFVASLGKVFFTGDSAVSIETGEVNVTGEVGEQGSGAFWATLFHPKVLGMIFVLLIAVFTIVLITAEKV